MFVFFSLFASPLFWPCDKLLNAPLSHSPISSLFQGGLWGCFQVSTSFCREISLVMCDDDPLDHWVGGSGWAA